MTLSEQRPPDVVAAYHEALSRRDYEAARSLLADDLHFRGPFDEFHRADDYLTAVRGLWQMVEGIEVRHRSSDGDQVVVLYDMATRTPAGTQLICEWFGRGRHHRLAASCLRYRSVRRAAAVSVTSGDSATLAGRRTLRATADARRRRLEGRTSRT